MKRLIFLNCFLLFFIGLKVNAQTKRNYETNPDYKRTNIWYFGQNAGIDFNTIPPTRLSNGKINTWEGCSSISDTSGNLLFYTDGRTVWNKNHQTMLNGTGLKGDISSTQSAIIIHHNDNDSLYYIITTPYAYDYNVGARYNIVNIYQNKVVTKNIVLHPNSSEKISAVCHNNGKDIWVVGHEYGNNKFFSYILTNQGFVKCGVISGVGSNLANDEFNNQGQIKFSSDGKLLAICHYTDMLVGLFDFDNKNGSLKAKRTIYTNGFVSGILPYSVDFSYNNSYLYILLSDSYFFQYNISSNKLKSIVKLTSGGWGQSSKSSIGKILFSYMDSTFLSSISNDNDSTASVKKNEISISPNKTVSSLPNFNQSYFYTPSVDFAYNYNCLENTILFEGRDTFYADSFKWLAKKVFGSQNYSSNSKKTVITFSDTGLYNVIFIAKNGSRSDSVYKQILIYTKINKDFLGKDTIYKSNIPFRLVLNTPANMHCISWQDSSTSPSLTIDTAGFYFVSITNKAFCTVYDTILVSRCENSLPKPTLRLNNDTLITSSTAADSIKWFKNGNLIKTTKDTFIVLSETGTYIVTLSKNNFCNSSSNPFNYTCLFGLKDPLLRLIKDTLIVSQIDADSFAWFKNNTQIKISNDSILLPNDTGIFKVAAFKGNYCQSNSNSIYIKCLDRLIKPTLRISKDTLFASSNFVDSFIWYKNGQIIHKNIDSFIVLTDTGYYRLEAFKHKYCLTSSNSFYVSCIDKLATPIIRQNRDSLFVTGVQADSFVWFKNGKELIITKTLQIKINDTGLYRVEARKNKYCNRISPILLVTKLNVNLVNTNDDTFRIYPNPTSLEINVKIFNANSDNISIQIFDAAGKQHFQQNYMSQNNSLSTKVDLANLSSGIYTVYIQELNYYYKLVVIK